MNVTPIDPYSLRSVPPHSGHSVSAGSANDWTVKHDLVDFVFKRGDDLTSDLSPVADKVRLALSEGQDILIRRLIERLRPLVMKASVLATVRRRPDQIDRIHADASKIVAMTWSDCTRLGDIRVAIQRFRREWNVEFDPALDRR